VANNFAGVRVLSYRFGKSERCKTQNCDKALQTQNTRRTVSRVLDLGSGQWQLKRAESNGNATKKG
jgi:hypothetical protein